MIAADTMDYLNSLEHKIEMECEAVKKYGDHLYTVVYRRSWRKFFRKTYVLRCWKCEIEIEEP